MTGRFPSVFRTVIHADQRRVLERPQLVELRVAGLKPVINRALSEAAERVLCALLVPRTQALAGEWALGELGVEPSTAPETIEAIGRSDSQLSRHPVIRVAAPTLCADPGLST
jgi:hypothetical protein